jgi:hydroxyacylglutathione hydrolase
MREAQIVDAIGAGVDRIPDIVARLYADVPHFLHGMAALTVRAHLDKLLAEGGVREDAGERFRPVG